MTAGCSDFGDERAEGADAGTGTTDAAVEAAADAEGGGSPGQIVEVATGENGPGPLAANAGGVYWVDKTGAIRRGDRAKTSPVTLALGPPDAVDLRLDVSTLYVYSPTAPLPGTTSLCNVLYRVETDGTKAQRIGLLGCAGFQRMTADATHVLLAGTGFLLVPRQSGTPTQVPDGTFKLGAVASDGVKMYWVRESESSIAVGPKGGPGTENKLLSQSPSKPMDLTIDLDPAGSVFWLTEGGEVMAQPKQSPGATPRTLASGQPAPVRIVVDETHVYWTNGSNGTVMRARKDGSGKAEPIASGLGSPFGLARVDGGVYVATREGRILFIPLGP